MMNKNERFSYLLNSYVDGSIMNAELDEFFNLVSEGEYDDAIQANFDKTIFEAEGNFSPQLPQHISHDLVRNILRTEERNVVSLKRYGFLTIQKLFIAASLLLFTVLSAYFLVLKNNENHFVSEFVKNSAQKVRNKTNKPMSITLTDGSVVLLQPKSALFYSQSQFASKREVYMDGEAYFTIAKDVSRPFYVYYNKVVTKVLGTSFHIKTNKNTGNVEIEVMTGKVQVYENQKIIDNKDGFAGLIITPNQKVIYQTDKLNLEATIADNPVPIPVIDDETVKPDIKAPAVDFNFENVRLSEVLKRLEESYGIEIVVTDESIYKAVFNGNITKENLFEKLKIICVASNSEYEINGTKILIKPKDSKQNN